MKDETWGSLATSTAEPTWEDYFWSIIPSKNNEVTSEIMLSAPKSQISVKKLCNIYGIIYLETCDSDRRKKNSLRNVLWKLKTSAGATASRDKHKKDRHIYLPSLICLHVVITFILLKSCRSFYSEKIPHPVAELWLQLACLNPAAWPRGQSFHPTEASSALWETSHVRLGRINTYKKKWGKSYVTLHGVLCTVNGTSPVFLRIKCPELKVRCILR